MRAPSAAALLLAAALVELLVPVHASSQAAPLSTPAACTKAVNDWRAAQLKPAREAYTKATDSTKPGLLVKYQATASAAMAGGQKMAADCAARFSVTAVPATQLMDLIGLYGLARDTTNSRLAAERLISAKNLPPRTQGQAYLLGISQEISKASALFGIIPGAEQYVAKLDALPDSLADLKLSAHRTMLFRYEYLDVAEGLHTHSTALIALAKKLNNPSDMIIAYGSLARSYADRLQPDSGLEILNQGEKEIGDSATIAFKDFRSRYALIGTPASAISAEWWINTDAKSVVTPVPGKVTLIEFTAHWCGPCKNSYPGIRSLAEKFKGKAFEGVMVTQLYGYIGTQMKLSPEQEIAADRIYFGTEHALPFPVAINAKVANVPPYTQPKPDTEYRVGGIPQIMIIDKRGIIRQIVTGWDQGNTARFSRYIEMLLNERVATP